MAEPMTPEQAAQILLDLAGSFEGAAGIRRGKGTLALTMGGDALREVDRLTARVAELEQAAPSVQHLRELVRWLDLIDIFASKVDPAYQLPRDEIQRDLDRLADALEGANPDKGSNVKQRLDETTGDA